MDSLVGKVLKNEKDEDYIVLSEFKCKDIPCVYAMKVEKNDVEGEKNFFQVTYNESPSLVNIKSKAMLKILSEALFEKNNVDEKPRKINDNESISDYLAYLDDYYKTKVITIV